MSQANKNQECGKGGRGLRGEVRSHGWVMDGYPGVNLGSGD